MKRRWMPGLAILGSLLLAAPGARAALPEVAMEEAPPPEGALGAKPLVPPANNPPPKKRRGKPSRPPGRERAPRKPDAETQAARPAPEVESRRS